MELVVVVAKMLEEVTVEERKVVVLAVVGVEMKKEGVVQ